MFFFRLSSWELALIIFAVVVGVTLLGLAAGRHFRERSDALREPFGVLQAALLGHVALNSRLRVKPRRRPLRVSAGSCRGPRERD
ncbi:MAG: hypothetical protein ACRDVN_14330 [Jiangellaceae bacterium]